MCNIIHFQPGDKINYEQFANCVYNNWHSYGLVIFDNDYENCEVLKNVPESGELDPKEIFDLLVKHEDKERLLHLRHNTAGATTIENTHPFTVFQGDAIRSGKKVKNEYIGFMHNGTMHQFISKKLINNRLEDDPTGKSDTLNFVEQRLQPFFNLIGDKDLLNPTVQSLVKVDFPATMNRGVIFNNASHMIFLGDWKVNWQDKDGNILRVANDTYFDKVTRGPEWDRREAVRKENEKKEVKVIPSVTFQGSEIAKYLEFKPDRLKGFFAIKKDLPSILSEYDIWTREGLVSLAYLNREEWAEIAKDADVAGSLLDFLSYEFASIYDEFDDLEEKKKKAELKCQEFAEENRALRAELQGLE